MRTLDLQLPSRSLLVIYFATTHYLLRQNHITLSLMASSVKCFHEVSQVRTRGGHSWKCGTKWKLGTLLGGPSSLRETEPRKKKTTLPELSWHSGTSPFSFFNYSFVLYIFEIFCVFVNKVLQGFTTLPDVGVMHLSRSIHFLSGFCLFFFLLFPFWVLQKRSHLKSVFFGCSILNQGWAVLSFFK